MFIEVWVPLFSALLGAAVGGVASLGGSIVVDRLRLRRDMRARIYDKYIGEATAALARWWSRSEEGGLDLHRVSASR